jgi:hypothetical protein
VDSNQGLLDVVKTFEGHTESGKWIGLLPPITMA